MTRENDLIIFDCDGVLVDSEVIAAKIETQILRDAGFDISEEELSTRFAGSTYKDILITLSDEQNKLVSATLIDQARAKLDHALNDVQPVPGARAAAEAVGTNRCICSNSGTPRLNITLGATNLKSLFEGRIYSAGEVGNKQYKPSPNVFEFAARENGLYPKQCFVIEDSAFGVRGAVAAGCRVIGFTGASHIQPGHADVLSEAGAETVIHRLADLPLTLEAMRSWSA